MAAICVGVFALLINFKESARGRRFLSPYDKDTYLLHLTRGLKTTKKAFLLFALCLLLSLIAQLRVPSDHFFYLKYILLGAGTLMFSLGWLFLILTLLALE